MNSAMRPFSSSTRGDGVKSMARRLMPAAARSPDLHETELLLAVLADARRMPWRIENDVDLHVRLSERHHAALHVLRQRARGGALRRRERHLDRDRGLVDVDAVHQAE